jgi:hypothetical protein
MKNKIFSLLFFVTSITAFATHNMGGEITYIHISGNTYKIIATIYSNTYNTAADRCELILHFGDGDTAVVSRVNGSSILCPSGNDGQMIAANTKLNIYETTHTFASSGSYIISMEDPNRNTGVCNIPSSVNTSFFLQTQLIINSFIGVNNSPQFLAPPIFFAKINDPYIQNLTAYDPDGDLLTYELISCMGNGQSIPGYSIPASFLIDSLNGEILWNAPTMICQYNFAVKVKKWRNGTMIGYVIRDFQINVDSNVPDDYFLGIAPWNTNQDGDYFYSVVAGDSIKLNLDYISNNVNFGLQAYGNTFLSSNPGQFNTIVSADTVHSTFKWNTNSSNMSPYPYIITFRGTSGDYNKDLTLMVCIHDGLSTPCRISIGVEEAEKRESKILLYPNPTNNYISISGLDVEKGYTLFIYDLTGRLIKSVYSLNNSQEISLTALKAGFYNYEIVTYKKIESRGKIIKN